MTKRKEQGIMPKNAIVRLFFFALILFGPATETNFARETEETAVSWDTPFRFLEPSVELGQFGFSRTSFPTSLLCPPFLQGHRRFEGFDFRPLAKRTRVRIWVRGFGNWTKIGRQEEVDCDVQSYGFSAGLDQQFGRNLLLGAAFGGNWSTLKETALKEKLSATYASIYGRSTLQRLFFDLEVGIGYNDYSSRSKSALQWNLNTELGTWWEQGLGKVEPYLGLRYVNLDWDPDTESKTTLLAGFRYSWKTTGAFAVTSPRFYAGVLHELGDRNLLNTASFVDAPTVYTLSGYKIPQTRLFCGGGFTSSMGTSLDLYVRYTAEVASNYASHTVLAGMNWNF